MVTSDSLKAFERKLENSPFVYYKFQLDAPKVTEFIYNGAKIVDGLRVNNPYTIKYHRSWNPMGFVYRRAYKNVKAIHFSRVWSHRNWIAIELYYENGDSLRVMVYFEKFVDARNWFMSKRAYYGKFELSYIDTYSAQYTVV